MPISTRAMIALLAIAVVSEGCSRAILEGSSAQLSSSDPSLSFGSVGVGQSLISGLNLNNIGETPASLVSMAFDQSVFQFSGGTFPGDNGNCSSELAPNLSNCTVKIAFTPTAQQTYKGNLLLTYHDGLVMTQTSIPLTGTGVSPGSYDPQFNSNGLITVDLGADDSIASIQVLPQGGLLAVSSTNNGTTQNVGLVGLQSNGLLDPAFGTAGIARAYIGVNTNDPIHSAVLQPDGKLITTGESNALLGGLNLDLALLRFGSTGALDSVFGSNGIVNLHLLLGGLGTITKGLATKLQSDGKVLVAGTMKLAALNSDFLVSRYSSLGVPDLTFGTLGVTVTGFGVNNTDVANAIAVQASGKILAAGSTDNGVQKDSAIIQLSGTTGLLDPSFGVLGTSTRDMCGTAKDDEIKAMALQSDAKIVLTGYCKNSSNNKDIFVTRLNQDGSLDSGFGTGGVFKLDIAGFDEEACCVAIQDDGKIVVGGYTNTGVTDVALAVRLNATGSLDVGFGTGGVLEKPVGSSNSRVQSLQLQGHKILLGGNWANTANNDLFIMRLFQ